MCRTYNTIGSLATLKSHLHKNNIYDFKSLREVVDFQNSYTTCRSQLISNHGRLIEEERKSLESDLQQLNVSIETQRQYTEQMLVNEIDELRQRMNHEPKNFFRKLTKTLRVWSYRRKIKYKEQNFYSDVREAVSALVEVYEAKRNRYQFIISQFNTAVNESCRTSLSELERKKTVIDGLNSFIYGAYGEQKVVKELEELSDEYFLINDFTVNFSPAIYNKRENDYIRSVQIDHILVAPSGIFLIETKNWSEKSLADFNLRSPVEQVKRANFILFKLLNNEINNYDFHLDRHHWGKRKIPIRNLIVLTGAKPREEFQFVKILTVGELLRYIRYFKPVFSGTETQRIADFLIGIK